MSKLLAAITMANGYRTDFVRFMETNLVEPRPNPLDRVYEWARACEAVRNAEPGAAAMQDSILRFERTTGYLDMLIAERAQDDDEGRAVLYAEKHRSVDAQITPNNVESAEKRYGITLRFLRAGLGMPEGSGGPPTPARDPVTDSVQSVARQDVVDAIRTLRRDERDNPKAWTKDGQPQVKAIEKVMGKDITAADRDAAWLAFLRDDASTAKLELAANMAPPAELVQRIRDARVTVTGQAVVDALRNSPLSRLSLSFLDRTYTALPMEAWCEILEWSDVDRVGYVSERRDCDNFAVALAGQVGLRFGVNGCGIVVDYSGRHAYNCLLVSTPDADGDGTPDLAIAIVEPQTDRMPQVGDRLGRHEAYRAERGWILLA